jgi:predicted RNase H-like HicB family nuclease
MTKKYMVILTEDEDGFITAEVPNLAGCVSQGKTRDEALTNIEEAISLWLETNAASGSPLQPTKAEVTEIQVSDG